MMASRALHRCRVLVVEDEYLLADELAMVLADQGAIVLGPVPSVEQALALLEDEAAPDGAVLDVNLGGNPVFPLADDLIARGVPMIFTTGYDATALPPRFAQVVRCEKPINFGRITAALSSVIHA
jgi:CheY-like chemotaxis protein